MTQRILLTVWTCLCLSVHRDVEAQLKVVASTTDMAAFARAVGGDLVSVEAIAPSTADVHFVEVRPSYMVKTSKADVAVKVGLELDLWMDRIIDGSHNGRITVIDASKYVEPLDVPAFKADARHGDLHRYGNPHYWLTPENAAPATRAILEGLTAADPEHAAQFANNRDAFLAELSAQLPALRERAAPLAQVKCLAYHTTWAYFCAFTGLTVAGFIEPYPGVPPSPSHVADLIEQVRSAEIKLIVVEPYFDKRVPQKIASETGARVITLFPSVGGRDNKETYIEFLQGNIDQLLSEEAP